MKKIAIIGSGSWGLALGKYLVEQGNDVKVWSFADDEMNDLNVNHHSKYLPDVIFPKELKAYTDFREVLTDAEYILHVTPSAFSRETIKKYKEYVNKDQKILICSKGFERETKKPLELVFSEEFPNNKIGVFSRTFTCRRSFTKHTYLHGYSF